MLVIGAGLGWILRSARIQREAVAAVKAAGGWVEYDWEWSNGESIAGGAPSAPRWLIGLDGIDQLGHGTALWLHASADAGGAVVHAKRLTRLQSASFIQSSLSDNGLAHLKDLAELANLDVSGTQVTDAGLVHVMPLTNLSRLGLHDTQVTDAGLIHLRGLTKLSVLDLGGTRVTDAGLASLKALKNLSNINLVGTRVTDAGAKDLQQALPGLRIFR